VPAAGRGGDASASAARRGGDAGAGEEPDAHAARLLERVEEIPPGFVRSYGDLSPGAPRYAGTVLRRWGDRVPWHRVVRADGSLAKGARQRALLEDESVPFRGERVDMARARMPI